MNRTEQNFIDLSMIQLIVIQTYTLNSSIVKYGEYKHIHV